MSTSCPYCTGVGTLEATDLFCGAGGSSLGLEFVCCPLCGRQLIKVTQALNHWDLAVQAHNENFPDADHDLHDVEVVPASRFRRTPLLWASPECVHHAYCRGKKSEDESAERSRMTMNDVVRFTEFHRYDAVIVENVIEARLWEPFDEWFQYICDLGYEGQIVYFNSQFALPTPQSRDRMYCVFWRKGLPTPELDFTPDARGADQLRDDRRGMQWWKKASPGSLRTEPGKFVWGRYGQQYVYACPALLPDRRSGGRRSQVDHRLDDADGTIGRPARPLAVKTRERIRTGLKRLSTRCPSPSRWAGICSSGRVRPRVVGRRSAAHGHRLPVHGRRRPEPRRGDEHDPPDWRTESPAPVDTAQADGHDHGPRSTALVCSFLSRATATATGTATGTRSRAGGHPDAHPGEPRRRAPTAAP